MSIEYLRLPLAILLAALVAGAAALLAILSSKVPVPTLWSQANVPQNFTKNAPTNLQMPESVSIGIGKFTSAPLQGLNISKSLLNRTVLKIVGKTESHYLRVVVCDLLEGKNWVRSKNIYSSYSTSIVPPSCNHCKIVCYTITMYIPMYFLPHVKYLYSIVYINPSTKIIYYRDLDVVETLRSIETFRACSIVANQSIDSLKGLTLSDYKNIYISSTYLQVPQDYRSELRQFAKKIVGKCGDDVYCIVKTLVNYISTHYRYSRLGVNLSNVNNIVRALVNAQALNCIQANTLLVLTLRTLGIPSRIVVGFYVNPHAESQYVKLEQLHAWAEVYNPRTHTWVRVDATPPATQTQRVGTQSTGGQPKGRGKPLSATGQLQTLLNVNVFNKKETDNKLRKLGLSKTIKISNLNIPKTEGAYEIFLRVLTFGNVSSIDKISISKYDLYWGNMTEAYVHICRYSKGYCTYTCYSISLRNYTTYIPHITVFIKLLNGGEYIHYYGGDIVATFSKSKYFKICSLSLTPRGILNILKSTTLEMYRYVHVPSIYLHVPLREDTAKLLREYLYKQVAGCENLYCVISKLYTLINSGSLIVYLIKKNVHDYTFEKLVQESQRSSLAKAVLLTILLRLLNVPARVVLGYSANTASAGLTSVSAYSTWRVEVYVPKVRYLWIIINPSLFKREVSFKNNINSSKKPYLKLPNIIRVARGNYTNFEIYIETHYRLTITFTVPQFLRINPRVVNINPGKHKIIETLYAKPTAKLGITYVEIHVKYNNKVDTYKIPVLVQAPTTVIITNVEPRYVAPGEYILVEGEVRDNLGAPVNQGTVVITLNKTKYTNGIVVCSTNVLKNGTFKAICKLPKNLNRGEYVVIVHYLGTLIYLPSKSDPPVLYVTNNPLRGDKLFIKCWYSNFIVVLRNLNITFIEELLLRNRSSIHILVPCRSFELLIPVTESFAQYLSSISYESSIDISSRNMTCSNIVVMGNYIDVSCTLNSNTGVLSVTYGGNRYFASFTIPLHIERLYVELSFIDVKPIVVFNSSIGIKLRLSHSGASSRLARSVTLKLYSIENSYECNLKPEGTKARGIIEFRLVCMPLHYDTLMLTIPLGPDEELEYIINKSLSIYSRLLFENVSTMVINESYIRVSGSVVDPAIIFLSRHGERSVPYQVTICAEGGGCNSCEVRNFTSGVVHFSFVLPKCGKVLLYAYAPYHFKSVSVITFARGSYWNYIPILVILCTAVALFSYYQLVFKRKRGLKIEKLAESILCKSVKIGNKVYEVRVHVSNYDELSNVWGLGENVIVRVLVTENGKEVEPTRVIVTLGNYYRGVGNMHEIAIHQEGVYSLSISVDDMRLADFRIYVVDYRKEIGRLFRDYIQSMCGINADKLTPRQIGEILKQKYDSKKDIIDELVRIHELATYTDRTVSRSLFIRFVKDLLELGVNVLGRYT